MSGKNAFFPLLLALFCSSPRFIHNINKIALKSVSRFVRFPHTGGLNDILNSNHAFNSKVSYTNTKLHIYFYFELREPEQKESGKGCKASIPLCVFFYSLFEKWLLFCMQSKISRIKCCHTF